MDRLRIKHIPYRLIIQDDYPYSVCENFVTSETELVTAWHIMQTNKKPNHISVYQHYLDCCQRLGIPEVAEEIDKMIVLDYLIVNEDRHQNNFGAIRNADTLKWEGTAPIYDSGSSLWFNKPIAMIGHSLRLECKPFKKKHAQQIKLVKSFDWVDLSKLSGINEEVAEIFRDSIFIDARRRDAICKALEKRIELLQDFINSRKQFYNVDHIAEDVVNNISYSESTLDL